MPRKGITAYDLLISCPGDLLDYLNVIKDSVESFTGCLVRSIILKWLLSIGPRIVIHNQVINLKNC